MDIRKLTMTLMVGCMVMLSACHTPEGGDVFDYRGNDTAAILADKEPEPVDGARVPDDAHRPDVKIHVKRGHTLAMHTEGLTLTAIDAAVQHEADYSVTSLEDEDLPPIPQGMTNMTASAAGYRLLPGGEHFLPYAELRVAYDPERLPEGYTPDDIYTSYYDTSARAWVRLERVEVDTANREVVSLTTHFTDFVNELLKAPEMPETQAFVPTAMSDLEAANPLGAYTGITVPSANNMGTANLTYPFVVPAGRGGLQPNVGLNYNSNGGNGVCGQGWDFSTSCVSVETRWGVPLYDSNLETETYVINGEQLVVDYDQLPAFARPFDTRMMGNVRFYPRVEGAFDSIIRHGNSPQTYWWEVFDRNGNQYIYGQDDNAVLKSQIKQGIGKWYLTKVTDKNGNTATYHYKNYKNNAEGRTSGVHNYLDHILYTLPNEGDMGDEWYGYQVSFYYGGDRQDPVISGNYGVKDNICQQLDSVKTWYVRFSPVTDIPGEARNDMWIIELMEMLTTGKIDRDEYNEKLNEYLSQQYGVKSTTKASDSSLIRGYRLLYGTSATGKLLLNAVVEMNDDEWSQYGETVDMAALNVDNNTFKYHRFTYNGLPRLTFGAPVTLSTLVNGSLSGNDEILASPLGGSTENRVSANFGVTIGSDYCAWLRTMNLELSGNVSPRSKNNGTTSMVDLNGDGYPDLLYRKMSGWRCQLFNPTTGTFENIEREVSLPTKGFSSSLTKNSFGIGPGIRTGLELSNQDLGLNAGIQYSHNRTENTMYFTDLNADGLTDIVKDGVVYFNNSREGVIAFDEELVLYPDAVHPCENSYFNMEGASTLNSEIFESGHVSTTHTSSINVSGRVGCYTNTNTIIDVLPEDDVDPVHRSVVRMWVAPKEGIVNISGVAQLDAAFDVARQNTNSDGVHVSIQKNGHTPMVAADIINSTPVSMNVNSVGVNACDRIYFRVEGLDDCDYDVVNWSPTITYSDASSSTIDAEGRNVNVFSAKQDFHAWQTDTIYMPKNGTVNIEANYSLSVPMSAPVVLRIVTNHPTGTGNWQQQVTIPAGTTVPNTNFSFTAVNLDSSEFVTFEAISASDVAWPKLSWHPHIVSNSFVDGSAANSTTTNEDMTHTTVYSIDVYPSPRYSFKDNHVCLQDQHIDTAVFKSFYRGWAAFAYNSTEMRDAIDETKIKQSDFFNLSAVSNLTTTAEDITSGGSISSLESAINSTVTNMDEDPVVSMSAAYDTKNTSSVWVSLGYRGFISDEQMSVFNWKTTQVTLENDDMLYPVTNQSIEASGLTAVGPVKVTAQDNASAHVTLSTEIEGLVEGIDGDWNPAQISANGGVNYTHGWNKMRGEFMDMNGDGYPDVISENDVQYSRPMGGLSTLTSGTVTTGDRGIQNVQYNAFNLQGGTGYAEYHKIGKGKSSVNAPQRNYSPSQLAYSNDYMKLAWMDLNGDGLPDCVKDDLVSINLGYDYYTPQAMSDNPLPKNHSLSNVLDLMQQLPGHDCGVTSIPGSVGFSPNRSFSFGMGSNESQNNGDIIYQDVNGDGLVDKVVDNSKVYFNKGWGFSTTAYHLSSRLNSTGVSFNSDINGNLTKGFVVSILGVPIKFNAFGGACFSTTTSTTEHSIIDMNGDGLPDIAYRIGNDCNGSKIAVHYNQLYAVDKLATVETFYGNLMTIEYAQADYSEDARQRPTVMSSLLVKDNTGNSSDVRLFEFQYANYTHSIAERTSYGFSSVVATQFNAGAPYRTVTQHYRTDSYKMRGLKDQEIITDDQQRKCVEYDWVYQLKQIVDGQVVPAYMQHCFDATWPAINHSYVKYFEPSTGNIKIETMDEYEHEGYGRVRRYSNYNNTDITDDDVHCDVYYTVRGRNQSALPEKMVVTNQVGQTLRSRRADYYPNGLLRELTVIDNNGTDAVTNLYYDNYGNLVMAELPENHLGDRSVMKYGYDNIMHMFCTSSRDSVFGLESRTQYDVRLGVPLVQYSTGGDSMTFSYDSWGRPLTIRSPQEANLTDVPTIQYQYWDGSNPSPAISLSHFHSFTGNEPRVGLMVPVSCATYSGKPIWAQTLHKSQQDHSLDVTTVVFVDGHGRVLQTRKTAVVDGIQTQTASGILCYDDLGRVVRVYDPTTTNVPYCNYYEPTPSGICTETQYDILDRETRVEVPSEGIVTNNSYDFVSVGGAYHFLTTVVDPNGGESHTVTDVRGLTLSSTDAESGTTGFEYDALGQVLETSDPEGFKVRYNYDMMGNLVRRDNADAGVTVYRYDPAGRLVNETNAIGTISYEYDYHRLIQKSYNNISGNNVTYQYGSSGTNAGRVTMVTDGTGCHEFDYDAMGNVTTEYRSVTLPGDNRSYRFRTSFMYDSWGRMLSMVYPDNEKVSYHYNMAGDLTSMDWSKGNYNGCYIASMLYNQFGQRSMIEYGNGTTTEMTYDPMHRLATLRSRDIASNQLQDINYSYDNMSNIIEIHNAASMVSTMGGDYTNNYSYDANSRLVQAVGNGVCGNFTQTMTYSGSGRLVANDKNASSATVSVLSDKCYGYNDSDQPHAPRRIADMQTADLYDLQWDAAGNLGQVNHADFDGQTFDSRFLFWTEDNRMHTAVDQNHYSYYAYDFAGERTVKLTGINDLADINAQSMFTFARLDNPTLYPSSYLVIGKHGYTKHYYAGTERVCAKIGGGFGGTITRVDPNESAVADRLFYETQGNVASQSCPVNDEGAINASCPELSIPITGNPTQLSASVYIELAPIHGVVEFEEGRMDREDEVFYYHSDHLGSASWITDGQGMAVQHLQYLPFGEPFVNEHATGAGYSERFTFTGKERDVETGYGYFGARYMDHELTTMWLSVDPMSDKYPSLSPYNYCAWNPIRFVDPNGDSIVKGQDYVARLQGMAIDIILKGLESTGVEMVEAFQTLNEISVLESSSQHYSITETDAVQGNENWNGITTFDLNSKTVLVEFKTGRYGTLAHELKHCFQFENGETSMEWDPVENCFTGGLLNNYHNERAAFSRGEVFGGDKRSDDFIRKNYHLPDNKRTLSSIVDHPQLVEHFPEATYVQIFYTEKVTPKQLYRSNGYTMYGKQKLVTP